MLLEWQESNLEDDDVNCVDAVHDARKWRSYCLGLDDCSDAEHRVMRQLVEALLFEKLVSYQVLDDRERHAAGNPAAAFACARLQFELEDQTYRCLAALTAFDRVRIVQGSIRRLCGSQMYPVRLLHLIEALPIDDSNRQNLVAELGQTVALCHWNRQYLGHRTQSRRHLSFQALETAIHEGHPYHPCFKTRIGFTLSDHQNFGPEAGERFQLHWLAIAKGKVARALPCDETLFWQGELGGEVYELLTTRLALAGESWASYSLVPVHPWQLQALWRDGLDRAQANGEVIKLGPAGDYYQATQSLRTLMNVSHPEKAHVKLPLNVICTSSRRNLQQHFVCTAPAISAWLCDLVARDPYLQACGHLLLLREYAGLLYEPVVDDPACASQKQRVAALQGTLGTILRESVTAHLQLGETAVPFTALMLIEADGKPFICEWLDVHGVERWLERLLEVMLVPLWHMLVHHGVAFEAHAQNLILIHRRGWPTRIALRDFHENTEYVTNYLANEQAFPDLAAIDEFFLTIADDEGYRMAEVDELRELFMDTVLVFNLADLAVLLARFCNFPEAAFWQHVREHLDAYARTGITARERIERLDAFAPTIKVESLLKKKIMGANDLELFHHRVRNCLNGQAVGAPETATAKSNESF